MKLFTKISLSVAAIAGGLGIFAVVIGLALGADVSDLNNMGIYLSPYHEIRKTVGKEIRDSVEAEVEAESDIENDIVIKNSHHVSQHQKSHHNEALHGHSCSLKGIDRLKVDVKNAQITIFAAEDDHDITYYYDREEDISKVNGSTLKLEDNTSLQDKIELEIYIPVGILKEIEIEAVNGTIDADKMIADNISIEIDNASVQIDELIVNDKAKLQINAGQMVIGYYAGNKLETECAMGSIMVVCEGNRSDYNYDLECGMGQIQIDTDSYSGIGEELQIHNKSSKFIKAECAMGEIILEFPNSL